MSGQYARLKEDWMLRGWGDLPRALVNWRTGRRRELSQSGFYVAQSCDGRSDFDSFAFLPKHHGALELMIAEGIAEPCRQGAALAPWQRYRKADNPILMGIHWCVTGFCNLHCRHCYMESPSGRYGQPTFAALARLVEQFVRANVIEVTLTGGEPFLRKDLLEIIGLLAKKRICLSQIYSNGLLITDRHLQGIVKLGFRPSFQISFDGVGAHDQMRGARGIEAGVIEAIRRLRAGGFPVIVATCIDKLNIGTLARTYELMKELDVQGWRISAPQETGNWRGTTTATPLDQQAEACVPLARRWVADGRPFHLQLGGFYNGLRPRPPGTVPAGRSTRSKPDAGRVRGLKRPAKIPEMRPYTPDGFDCGACREQSSLLPDGTLVPCPGYVGSSLQDRMPNLLREELSEVWTHSFLRTISNLRKKDLLAANSECATCSLFKECGVGCRASALTATGNLLAKDPLACELAKKGYQKQFLKMAAGQPLMASHPGCKPSL